MTPIFLLDRLQAFIEATTADIMLATNPEKGGAPDTRAARVYKMRLPERDVGNATEKRVPYIILQVLTGMDEYNPGDPQDSTCKVRIIVCTYSEDGGEGANDVLNVISRIRIALLKAGEVGAQFLLRSPLEYIIYPNDANPFFYGEIMSIWEMPVIRREVNALLFDEATTSIKMM